MIKYLVTFIAGAAVGGTAAAFFVKKKCEKKAEDQLSSMREYVRKLETQVLDAYKTNDGDADDYREVPETENVLPNSKKSEKCGYKNDESSTNYHKYQAPYAYKTYGVEYEHPEDDEDEDFDGNLMEERSRIANSKEKPKLISADSYDDMEFEHHDKVQLEFYQEDCVLFNPEENEIVTDPVALLGDCMEKFGFIHSTEKVIYVRNVSRGTDYEIVKIFDAYGE